MKLEKSFDLCREAEEYHASTHLLRRMRERVMIDDELVAEVIEEGSVQRTDDDGVVLRHQWLQSKIEVVIAPKDQVIQTAYEVEP